MAWAPMDGQSTKNSNIGATPSSYPSIYIGAGPPLLPGTYLDPANDNGSYMHNESFTDQNFLSQDPNTSQNDMRSQNSAINGVYSLEIAHQSRVQDLAAICPSTFDKVGTL